MKKLLFVVSFVLISVHADSAHSQTSSSSTAIIQSQAQKIDALEKKVNDLEKKVTEILQLLKARQQSNPVIPAPSNTSGPAPQTPPDSTTSSQDELFSGPRLEAWPLPSDFRGNTPPGMSMGSIVDSGTLFNIDNFLSEDSFQSLKGSVVGLKWSGWIHIKEKGDYNIILERIVERAYGTGYWFASFKIEDQTIFSKAVPVYGLPYVETQVQSLDPGFHKFELFTYSSDYAVYSRLQLRVKLRSEDSPLPITLDARNVFHKE